MIHTIPITANCPELFLWSKDVGEIQRITWDIFVVVVVVHLFVCLLFLFLFFIFRFLINFILFLNFT